MPAVSRRPNGRVWRECLFTGWDWRCCCVGLIQANTPIFQFHWGVYPLATLLEGIPQAYDYRVRSVRLRARAGGYYLPKLWPSVDCARSARTRAARNTRVACRPALIGRAA